MPLHPTKYAEMLSKKKEADVKVWLINTGWTGGAYGTSRMKLKYTRAMITALNGELDAVDICSFLTCYTSNLS
jgi:phosphoenolpyruvate carboxykinase (ATP)